MATSNPFQAIADAQDFLLDRTAETPELFRNKLRDLVRQGAYPLPIATRDIAELIYAWRDQLPQQMLVIGVNAALSLIGYQQFSFQLGRGASIVAGLQGDERNPVEPVAELTPAGLEPRPEPEAPVEPAQLEPPAIQGSEEAPQTP